MDEDYQDKDQTDTIHEASYQSVFEIEGKDGETSQKKENKPGKKRKIASFAQKSQGSAKERQKNVSKVKEKKFKKIQKVRKITQVPKSAKCAYRKARHLKTVHATKVGVTDLQVGVNQSKNSDSLIVAACAAYKSINALIESCK